MRLAIDIVWLGAVCSQSAPRAPARTDAKPTTLAASCTVACCNLEEQARRGPDGAVECCFCTVTVSAPRQSFTTEGAPHRILLTTESKAGELLAIEHIELVPDSGPPVPISPRDRTIAVARGTAVATIELRPEELPLLPEYHFRIALKAESGEGTVDAFVARAFRDPTRR